MLLAFVCSPIVSAQDVGWSVNPHDYEYDMTIYAGLTVGGSPVVDFSDYLVAAFVNGECRGVATAESTQKDGKTYSWLYLRVRSNVQSGETVSFKLYKKSTGRYYNIKETVDFESLGQIAMPSSPMTLTCLSQGDVNSDNSVDALDLMMLINYVLNPDTSSLTESEGDIDADGSVDALDIMKLTNIIIEK